MNRKPVDLKIVLDELKDKEGKELFQDTCKDLLQNERIPIKNTLFDVSKMSPPIDFRSKFLEYNVVCNLPHHYFNFKEDPNIQSKLTNVPEIDEY